MNYVHRILNYYGIKIFNLNRLAFSKMIKLKHFKIHLNVFNSLFAINRNKNYYKKNLFILFKINKMITNNNIGSS